MCISQSCRTMVAMALRPGRQYHNCIWNRHWHKLRKCECLDKQRRNIGCVWWFVFEHWNGQRGHEWSCDYWKGLVCIWLGCQPISQALQIESSQVADGKFRLANLLEIRARHRQLVVGAQLWHQAMEKWRRCNNRRLLCTMTLVGSITNNLEQTQMQAQEVWVYWQAVQEHRVCLDLSLSTGKANVSTSGAVTIGSGSSASGSGGSIAISVGSPEVEVALVWRLANLLPTFILVSSS